MSSQAQRRLHRSFNWQWFMLSAFQSQSRHNRGDALLEISYYENHMDNNVATRRDMQKILCIQLSTLLRMRMDSSLLSRVEKKPQLPCENWFGRTPRSVRGVQSQNARSAVWYSTESRGTIVTTAGERSSIRKPPAVL